MATFAAVLSSVIALGLGIPDRCPIVPSPWWRGARGPQDEFDNLREEVARLTGRDGPLARRLLEIGGTEESTLGERREAFIWLGRFPMSDETIEALFSNILLHLPGRESHDGSHLDLGYIPAGLAGSRGFAVLPALLDYLSRPRPDRELAATRSSVFNRLVSDASVAEVSALFDLVFTIPSLTDTQRANLMTARSGSLRFTGCHPESDCYCNYSKPVVHDISHEAREFFSAVRDHCEAKKDVIRRLCAVAADGSGPAPVRAEAIDLLTRFPTDPDQFYSSRVSALQFLGEHIGLALDMPSPQEGAPPETVYPCREALVRVGLASLRVLVDNPVHQCLPAPTMTPEIAAHYAYAIQKIMEPLGIPGDAVRELLMRLGRPYVHQVVEAYR